MVGIAVNGEGDLEKLKECGNLAFQLAVQMSSKQPLGVIIASLEPGPRFYYYHKNKKDEKIEEFEEVIYVEDSSGYLWKTMHLLQCKMKLNIPIYAESFNNTSGEFFLFD